MWILSPICSFIILFESYCTIHPTATETGNPQEQKTPGSQNENLKSQHFPDEVNCEAHELKHDRQTKDAKYRPYCEFSIPDFVSDSINEQSEREYPNTKKGNCTNNLSTNTTDKDIKMTFFVSNLLPEQKLEKNSSTKFKTYKACEDYSYSDIIKMIHEPPKNDDIKSQLMPLYQVFPLSNFKNNSYINSVLQALRSCDNIRKFIEKWKDKSEESVCNILFELFKTIENHEKWKLENHTFFVPESMIEEYQTMLNRFIEYVEFVPIPSKDHERPIVFLMQLMGFMIWEFHDRKINHVEFPFVVTKIIEKKCSNCDGITPLEEKKFVFLDFDYFYSFFTNITPRYIISDVNKCNIYGSKQRCCSNPNMSRSFRRLIINKPSLILVMDRKLDIEEKSSKTGDLLPFTIEIENRHSLKKYELKSCSLMTTYGGWASIVKRESEWFIIDKSVISQIDPRTFLKGKNNVILFYELA